MLLLLLAPRLALLGAELPRLLAWGIGASAAGLLLWWGLLAISYASHTALLPERLAERGPLLFLMRRTSRLAERFGRRYWVEYAAVKV